MFYEMEEIGGWLFDPDDIVAIGPWAYSDSFATGWFKLAFKGMVEPLIMDGDREKWMQFKAAFRKQRRRRYDEEQRKRYEHK